MADSRYVTGLFQDHDSAERAYSILTERGYGRDDVDLVMSDDTRRRHFGPALEVTSELGTKAAEGAGIGGAIGGTVVAITAAIAALGTTLVLPGLGLVIAGPIAAALAGAGAGGAAGGLVGALVGSGIPEERIAAYESGLREGGILIGVRPRNEMDARALERSWSEANGRFIAA